MGTFEKIRVRLTDSKPRMSDVQIGRPEDVAAVLGKFIINNDSCLALAYLNAKGQVLAASFGTEETLKNSSREMFKEALIQNAAAMIFVKSRDLQQDDYHLLKIYNDTGIILGLKVVDYVGIMDNGVDSARRNGTFEDCMSDGSDAWIAAVHVDVGTAALENKIDPKVKVERDGCLPLIMNYLGEITLGAAVPKVVEELRGAPREHFAVLSCKTTENGETVPLAYEIIAIGDISSTIIHPREVFAAPVLMEADKVMLFHNHPSGNAEPSREDIVTTDRLIKAGGLLGIDVKEHYVVGNKALTGICEEGLANSKVTDSVREVPKPNLKETGAENNKVKEPEGLAKQELDLLF